MFKNIFKIIKYDVNTQIVIFNKIKITFKNNAMKKILKDIEKENNFEDYKKRNVDITQVPQAKGILREKQLKCLEILKKVANICDENNINYWLAFGTLLGAYRHKGFIPWDDDIDLDMERSDYEKIYPILKEALKDDKEWNVREFFNRDFQLRVYNTKNEHIGLDIFPMDEIYIDNSDEKSLNSLNKLVHKAFNAFDKIGKKYTSATSREEANKDALKITNDIVKTHSSNNENATKILFYGVDFHHPMDKCCQLYGDIFPLTTIKFEDEEFKCPKNYLKVLEDEFGDYMSYPKKFKYIL